MCKKQLQKRNNEKNGMKFREKRQKIREKRTKIGDKQEKIER